MGKGKMGENPRSENAVLFRESAKRKAIRYNPSLFSGSPRGGVSDSRPGAFVSTSLLDKRETRIRRMFGDIAPRYDLLNHLLA